MVWILVGSGVLLGRRFPPAGHMVNVLHPDWQIGEKWFSAVLCSIGILAILLIGLLPDVILPGLLDLIQVYTHLEY